MSEKIEKGLEVSIEYVKTYGCGCDHDMGFICAECCLQKAISDGLTEIKQLEAEHSILLAQFSKVDLERLKLEKKVDELENVINSACDEEPYSFSSYCSGLIYNHDKEIEEIKKKLEKAKECIEKMCYDDCAFDLKKEERYILADAIKYHDKIARAYLKENV